MLVLEDGLAVDVASVLDIIVTKDILDVVLVPIIDWMTLTVGQTIWFWPLVEQEVTVVVVDIVVTVMT